MSLFNSKNEMAATSKKEALQMIAKMASLIQDGESANNGLAGSVGFTEQQRDEMVKRAMTTADGKVALGQAMALPIRRNLDYKGIARRCLVVDPLPQGAIPRYDRDIDVAAMVVSSQGGPVESQVRGDSVIVPIFTIAANPVVKISEVRQRRFNVIERAIQKAGQEIQAQEDANIFAAFDSAADTTTGGENTAQDIADAGLSRKDLVEIKSQVDRWDLLTTKFLLNIKEYVDILNWSSNNGSSAADVDPVTQREILQTGLYARVFGADLMVSKLVPVGTVFGLADPEFVGVMPVMQDIETMPADEPKRLMLGWVVSEMIGIGIVNPRGAACGRKSTEVG
jgi:hypothetical protein